MEFIAKSLFKLHKHRGGGKAYSENKQNPSVMPSGMSYSDLK